VAAVQASPEIIFLNWSGNAGGYGGAIYILVNAHHTVFYTGVTADLVTRITEHREKQNLVSFTAKYNVTKLVYYERFHSIEEAIAREKQVKKYSRFKKVQLIVKLNTEWKDLYEDIKYWSAFQSRHIERAKLPMKCTLPARYPLQINFNRSAPRIEAFKSKPDFRNAILKYVTSH
jgi:putative endonuclease